MDVLSAQTASSDYLSLLTVQLQNQDPIDPVDQEGLINDLTQFSILEGIQNLNASFEEVRELQEFTQGAELVGREIEYRDPGSGQTLSGIASSLVRSDGQIRISIDNKAIAIADVISISQTGN